MNAREFMIGYLSGCVAAAVVIALGLIVYELVK